MQGHVQRFHNHRQVLSVRSGVVVDVVVALVNDTLGMIQRRVDPVKADAVCRQCPCAQVNGCRKISTSGLAHCQHQQQTTYWLQKKEKTRMLAAVNNAIIVSGIKTTLIS